ncbi:Cobalt-precorrin-2 C(20)-methyltransferase [hydrothermal vent metagenome]|uniref:Cobalt-precorrin-2 C(20)-methyltransferase n=1 Tax=hydrothermal vent metagenome TaxID=652676 RepID=A0A3B1AI27_9ZZZZ
MNNKKSGTLYGVSLGPGDPGLITRRAWDILQQETVFWTYPIRNKKSDSYALDIVLRSGLKIPKDHAALIFPMTHDKEKLSKYWLNAAQTVVNILQKGQDVAFLVEGDASTYSTFGHLARTVQTLAENIDVQTIAGVTSFNSAAAQLQQPLADVDDTIAIIPAGYGLAVISTLLQQFDTLVLLKVKPLLDDIIDLLDTHGLHPHSHFIEKAGSPEERIVHNIANLKGQKVNYLSLMIVKNPQRQRGEIIRGCRKKNTTTQEDNLKEKLA